MNQTLLKQNLKVIFLLHLSLGLLACTPPDELEQQDLLKFNKRNAPEFKIVDRVLYVDSLGDIENKAPRLKLKVPMNYLQGGIGSDGRIGQILSTGGGHLVILGLKIPMKFLSWVRSVLKSQKVVNL